MPYADPEKQREAKRQYYRKRYAKDRKFRHAESDRKAEWVKTPEGEAKNREASLRNFYKKLPAAKQAATA